MLVQSELNLLFAYAYKNVGLVSLADYFCSTVQITSIITHIRCGVGAVLETERVSVADLEF